MKMGDVKKAMSEHFTDMDKVITESMCSSERKGLSEADAKWNAWEELVFGWDVPRFSAMKYIDKWLEENIYES